MKSVKTACQAHYNAWKYDCSGFLKAVAADFGITLKGQANDIIDTMARPPWIQVGHDASGATSLAAGRYLVVAGLKARANGHVAIIVPGSAEPYPRGYWGSISHHPGYDMTLNYSWSHADLPGVCYYACPLRS